MSFKIRASHILVERSYEIDDLKKKIAQGEAFCDLASRFSKCPSGQRGGDLGDFGRGKMVPAFEEAAFALEIGQVSDCVQSPFGYHLILRTA